MVANAMPYYSLTCAVLLLIAGSIVCFIRYRRRPPRYTGVPIYGQ